MSCLIILFLGLSFMSIPFPGEQVRGSKTGKPIMALLDLLGRTWALGVLWHLNTGPATFRELQQRCEKISPTLLNTRLKELKLLNLIEVETTGYQLSKQGIELFNIIAPLGIWSTQWAEQFETQERCMEQGSK
jgi:DNA-binding HxlR family transcriptional regulator